MVTFVVIFNLLIALVNLFIAWRIWKLRRVLANVADTLINVERSIHSVLAPAPEVIAKGQKGTNNLRERYQKLELQLQRLGQILTILSLGYKIWQRQSRRGRYPRRRKKQRTNGLLFP
ncbi:MAG: hypothetical protein AB4426_19740 [Xenococcaceae cyanobacterium]